MKDYQDQVWIGSDEFEQDPAFLEHVQKEFPTVDTFSETVTDEKALAVKANRRDFLKYLGFGLGAATMAASCDIPVKKAIPYVVKPDEIVPGIATYYASSFVNGGDYCPILVKTREGRPIKVEGNTMSSITHGGTNARTQAYVLSLYDTNRIEAPELYKEDRFAPVSWKQLDEAVSKALAAGGNTRIVTNTVMSPSAQAAIKEFTARYPNSSWVKYDPISSSAILQANQQTFGTAFIPGYHFDRADYILSFGADFLGTWISPIEYAHDYSKNRKIDAKNPKMSRHIQVESYMSLTGSNADNRFPIKPSQMGAAIATVYNSLAAKSGSTSISAPRLDSATAQSMAKVADQLWAHRGKSLVVSGSNNKGEQILVNAINHMLGNYGATIDLSATSNQRQGMDSDIRQLAREVKSGQVENIIFWNCNPVFDLPDGKAFGADLEKVKNKIAITEAHNDTSDLCTIIAPAHHGLESWGDVAPKKGHYSLIQPAISPLFDTRQAELNFLIWSGSSNIDPAEEAPYQAYVQNHWRKNIYSSQTAFGSFQPFWDAKLHDGIYEPGANSTALTFSADVASAAANITKPSSDGLEITLFETIGVGSGQYLNNPWLLEMPDPLTRCTWGNYLTIPVEWDGKRHFRALNGLNPVEFKGKADIVDVEVAGKDAKRITVVRQFGQPQETVAIGLGFGRSVVGSAGANVGVNVQNWLRVDSDGNTQYHSAGVSVSDKIATEHEFACVQYHDTMGMEGQSEGEEGTVNVDEIDVMHQAPGFQGGLVKRSVIRNANVKNISEFETALQKERAHHEHLNDQTLYPYEEYKEKFYDQGHHWGLYVDMNACIGCSACTIACMSENNVPVVGKTEVSRHHEMAWLRIDRYFYGDVTSPNVVYQPMMCQHCDNAPCENVCPVNATNHSSEGLNQMTYNRCIGTRYCANNCPYKVRRFNWLDYTTADLFPINEPKVNDERTPFGADNLTRMVLNPDVTVRSRGVIEKCSFCVQRIQEGKLTAKMEKRHLQDSDVKTACQTACPTNALTFGDTNNKNGDLAQKLESPINYIVLEETNVRSSVTYAAKINNRDESLNA